MCLHCRPGPFLPALIHPFQNLPVLLNGKGLVLPVPLLGCGGGTVPKGGEQLEKLPIVCRPPDGGVELLIVVLIFLLAHGVPMVLGPLLQRRQLPGIHGIFGSSGRRLTLQQNANLKMVLNEFLVDSGDDGAPVHPQLQQPLRRQRLKGLPHRCPGYAQLGRHFRQAQLLSGLILPGKQRLSQNSRHPNPNGQHLNRFHRIPSNSFVYPNTKHERNQSWHFAVSFVF